MNQKNTVVTPRYTQSSKQHYYIESTNGIWLEAEFSVNAGRPVYYSYIGSSGTFYHDSNRWFMIMFSNGVGFTDSSQTRIRVSCQGTLIDNKGLTLSACLTWTAYFDAGVNMPY